MQLTQRAAHGFTLIELLIVIAIIGILAAVMMPQLIGARVASQRRAIQTHSHNVYTAVTAIISEGSSTAATIATAATTACLTATNEITVGTINYKFGWSEPSRDVVSCTITPEGGNDFIVTVTSSSSLGSVKSVNGKQPTP